MFLRIDASRLTHRSMSNYPLQGRIPSSFYYAPAEKCLVVPKKLLSHRFETTKTAFNSDSRSPVSHLALARTRAVAGPWLQDWPFKVFRMRNLQG